MPRGKPVVCPEVQPGLSPFLVFIAFLVSLGLATTLFLINGGAEKKKQERKGRKSASGGKKFCIGGNWKCETNTAKVAEIIDRLNGMASIPASIEIFAAPPAPHLATVVASLRPDIAVSSQDCSDVAGKYGAFTGEAFAGMLKDIGCEWAIVGHSERRKMGETSELVASKAKKAISSGLGAVICIGETLEEREKGTEMLKKRLLDDQMAAVVKALGTDPKVWADIVIAYEPVWAIGTGKSAKPEDAQTTHKIIRDWVSKTVSPEVASALRIQYGGSVKGKTAEELARQPDVDGFLVGGSSLKDDFLDIISNAEKAITA